MKRLWILVMIFALVVTPAMATQTAADDTDTEEETKPMSDATFSGLEWRLIGPAYNSGRVSDFAVHPDAHHIIYAATASGGLPSDRVAEYSSDVP